MLLVFFASMAAALFLGLVVILCRSSILQKAHRNRASRIPLGSYLTHVFYPLGGVRFEIRAWNRTLKAFISDCEQVEALVESIESEISTWRKESAVYRINSAPPEREFSLPMHLASVLRKAFELCSLTGGAFNPALGPATELWRRRVGEGRRPSKEELAALLPFTKPGNFHIDFKRSTCTKASKEAKLDLDGLAVGYIVDQVFRLLKARGQTDIFVRAGYEVRVGSHKLSRKVAIEDPLKPGRAYGYLYLAEGALSTAGSYVRSFKSGKKRYGRILDPSSLEPLASPLSVSVLAEESATADALATALLVMGPEKGVSFAEITPGVEVLYLLKEGEDLIQRRSRGFPEVLDIRRENQPFPLP